MINHHLTILVDQLRAEGIADPLAQSFTLAALWDDLAAIVGESPPAAVEAVLGGEPCPRVAPPDGARPLPVSTRRPGGGGR